MPRKSRKLQSPRRQKKLLTACQQYTLLVGEIGIPRNEFLYVLKLWEINAIVKGYRRRNREHWEMSRHLGLTLCNVMGAKIDSAHDYLPLPWDDITTKKELTEKDVNELMELMRKENEEIAKKEIQKNDMQSMQSLQPTKNI